MTCLGVLIEATALPSLANDLLVLRYLNAFIDDIGELSHPMSVIDKMVKDRFGTHLSVKYGHPKTNETYDEPCGHFILTLVSESYFYSKEMQ